ncbi:MAG: glutathione S-transferase C-terminal domain-containing protein [Pseudomonadota bacterium]
MGMLIDGKWCADEDRFLKDGAFTREASALPIVPADHLEPHLAVDPPPVLLASPSCPWSHRATLVRAVKRLYRIPVVRAVGPRVEGYALPDQLGVTIEGNAVCHVHELYSATDPSHTGRATVPLLWDVRSTSILSNDSKTIARALDRLEKEWRLAPDILIADIESLNGRIYAGLANAVYRAGLATRQNAYDTAASDVFATLDWLETLLSRHRCLIGNQVTEADLFLFATLVRFDAVYVSLFRCTRRRLVDYPALWAYARDVYSWPGVAGTVDFQANLEGYFLNDTDTNPHGIVPDLPTNDWTAPHGRQILGPLRISRNGKEASFEEAVAGGHD